VRQRTEPGPKYRVTRDRRVRRSHSPAKRPPDTFHARAIPATLERRERAAPLSSAPFIQIAPGRARSAHVKPSLKSQLFGIAVTLSVFAAFFAPLVAKRW